MPISVNHVISVHYNLRDDNNELIDSTYDEDKPMVYLHGRRQMITGFETEVAGAAIKARYSQGPQTAWRPR